MLDAAHIGSASLEYAVLVVAIVLLWMIPALGLLITSLRPAADHFARLVPENGRQSSFYLLGWSALAPASLVEGPWLPRLAAAALALALPSALFLLAGAQLLAVATIVVYAGAIVVMFLFLCIL